MVSGTLIALDHKRKMLENLIKLFLANYFAEPESLMKEQLKEEGIRREVTKKLGKNKRINKNG
jgi:hypothetical protein